MNQNLFEEYRLKGIPICPGIAIGKPLHYTIVDEKVPEFSVPEEEIDQEVARYHRALKNSQKDLASLQKRLQNEGGTEAAAILGAHLEIIHDPLMTVQMEEKIRSVGKNTEYVFKSVIGEYEERFSKITDIFFRQRMTDFQDISRRIIGHLRQQEQTSLKNLQTKAIVFANDLLPTDTAESNAQCIEAFVTRSSAETSHVAIMARAKGIPFVSDVDFPDFSQQSPSCVIVDGTKGEVIFHPTQETLAHYTQEREKFRSHVKGLEKVEHLHSETIDGYRIYLTANVEMFSEVDSLEQSGGQGIGLFRTEYLFLARDGFPTEEDQFQIYKNVIEKNANMNTVIRTFDIGGDKFGNFTPSRYEKNPFLGCRAIRLMLKEKTAFKTQLRAILRASLYGKTVGLLFPMISGVLELREAKALLEEVKEELKEKEIPFADHLRIGCMIEVPSAVMTCDILAKECDFLSIGTNDLVQYALAVDRSNPAMSYLYKPSHPSIIRMIKMVVDVGNRAGARISVCGEIAADPRFTALLIGLGVHELSVSTPTLPMIKNVLRQLTIVDAVDLADSVLSLSTYPEVEEALNRAYENLTTS